jgi:hypothetical protein
MAMDDKPSLEDVEGASEWRVLLAAIVALLE